MRKNCRRKGRSQLFYRFTRAINISFQKSRNYYMISRHTVINPSIHTKYCDLPSIIIINPGIQKLLYDNSVIHLSILSELRDLGRVMKIGWEIQNWLDDTQTQHHRSTHHYRTQTLVFSPYKTLLSIMNHKIKEKILQTTDHYTSWSIISPMQKAIYWTVTIIYAFTVGKSNERTKKN